MVDVLAIGAHPDDCEMFLGGTLLKLKQSSHRIAICDLTGGEAGTYGSAEIRAKELKKAGEVLGLDHRITLDLPDGNIRNTEENRLKIIDVIRELRPEIVFSFNGELKRHPDHYYCGTMVKECCFLAGLEKLHTRHPAFRPSNFIAFPELVINKKPDFVVDITEFRSLKIKAIQCYSTQVTLPGEEGENTKTLIRSNSFWEILEARSVMAGAMIGVKYGEPFYCDSPPKVSDPLNAFKRGLR